MAFGQLIIGPPGSGKTTYCTGVAQFLRSLGRVVCIVNLDPANDRLPYECAVDLSDLVSVEEVQSQLALGPNGALVYCMDYLRNNLDWLHARVEPHMKAQEYFLFDCPGQAELHMAHESFRGITDAMTKEWHMCLAVVQLVDSHLCIGPHKLLSALLMCLTSMLHLELPHVNVLSKVDLLDSMLEGDPYDVEQLTDVNSLRHQLETTEQPFASRFRGLSTGLCEVLDSYGLLNFSPLSIQDASSVRELVDIIDGANGYKHSGLQGQNPYPVALDEDS